MNYCESCGIPLRAQASFCGRCGKPAAPAGAAAATGRGSASKKTLLMSLAAFAVVTGLLCLAFISVHMRDLHQIREYKTALEESAKNEARLQAVADMPAASRQLQIQTNQAAIDDALRHGTIANIPVEQQTPAQSNQLTAYMAAHPLP